jgi:hypothetical protein
MIRRRHIQDGTGTVLRAVLAWVVIGVLVLSSAFSVHAHAFHPGHGGTLWVSQDTDLTSDEQPSGDLAERDCHCACQHFGGISVPFAILPPIFTPAARIVAVLSPVITSPPAAPHPPPIA